MKPAPLLIEIGCEEIPARMIPGAARDLGRGLERLLSKAGLGHGEVRAWGGSRRLTVRVENTEARQEDQQRLVLGPPVDVALTAEGKPTPAAVGFARKQGIDPSILEPRKTDRGTYVGFVQRVEGRTVGQVLAEQLPQAVQSISFPKTMRWGDGRWRWVRPVHWVLALHGGTPLALELFGVASAANSIGHRFLSDGAVAVVEADVYESALEAARVIVDPAERRRRLEQALTAAATEMKGQLVPDRALLDEVADLIEWPGIVGGMFDAAYLELPRELLVTTLRHHQKCFSVQDADGTLLPGFLAVANTDRDPSGHVRRGNEWVVGGRLHDARFFWNEDRRIPLAERAERLSGVIFHRSASYADKAARMGRVAEKVAGRVGLDGAARAHCRQAAELCKVDLVTGTVGEFPELQGVVGGLMLRAEGYPEPVAGAVYSHYQPAGPGDSIPETQEGCVVSLTDKLDSTVGLIRAGKTPTGSRDPFGLRRASNGIFRVVIEHVWNLSIRNLVEIADGGEEVLSFLMERLQKFLRDQGYSQNEINAVLRPRVSQTDAHDWPVHDVVARLDAIRPVVEREDFVHLVDLTKRVDNILAKNERRFKEFATDYSGYEEAQPAALALWTLAERQDGEIAELEANHRYPAAVDALAGFVEPVDRFFEDVLVMDLEHPEAMLSRRDLLSRLRGVLTRCFDIRELAGQADRRG